MANVLLRETSGEVDNAAAFVSEDDDASKAVSDIDSENKFVVIAWDKQRQCEELLWRDLTFGGVWMQS